MRSAAVTLSILTGEGAARRETLMKEVVVILSLMCAGHLVMHGGTQLAEQLHPGLNKPLDWSPDPRFASFTEDRSLSRNDIERYKRIYGIPSLKDGHSDTRNRCRYVQGTFTSDAEPCYSQPSSLISVTSNPSDRSASPAIF